MLDCSSGMPVPIEVDEESEVGVSCLAIPVVQVVPDVVHPELGVVDGIGWTWKRVRVEAVSSERAFSSSSVKISARFPGQCCSEVVRWAVPFLLFRRSSICLEWWSWIWCDTPGILWRRSCPDPCSIAIDECMRRKRRVDMLAEFQSIVRLSASPTRSGDKLRKTCLGSSQPVLPSDRRWPIHHNNESLPFSDISRRQCKWITFYHSKEASKFSQEQVRIVSCEVVVIARETKIACRRSRSCFTLIYPRLRVRVGTCQSLTFQLNSRSLASNLLKRFLLRPRIYSSDSYSGLNLPLLTIKLINGPE